MIDLFHDDPKEHYKTTDLRDLHVTGYLLKPGAFVLAETLEWVTIPDDIVGRLEGKSSLGRLGLLVHATAGYIDPGFKGTITLELKNLNDKHAIVLRTEMFISQLSFHMLNFKAERPYGTEGLGSHYQNQTGATPASGKRYAKKL